MGATTTAVRAAGALVLVALLAGCTGDSGIVTTTPTPTAVASSEEPSATPSPTPSSGGELTDEELLALMPDGAAVDDLGGAMVTALFWLESLGRAYESGETGPVVGLATVECNYCRVQAESIQEARVEGWTVAGGEISVDTSRTEAATGSDGFDYVALIGDLTEVTVTSPSGEQSVANDAGLRRWTLQMEFDGRLWRVNGVELAVL